jgi:2,4-dienoyl-CoA reductase-like NADH-dependent reductase (Old Yellow Enzyme family)
VSRLLADAGVDAVDVSLIAQGSWKESDGQRFFAATSALPKTEPAGANIPLAKAVREASGLPVIAVGKLGERTLAADAVCNQGIDLVAIGRQLIVDPDTAGKILSGKGSEIVPCEECMTCFATIGRGKPMGCKVNRNLPGSA